MVKSHISVASLQVKSVMCTLRNNVEKRVYQLEGGHEMEAGLLEGLMVIRKAAYGYHHPQGY